MESESLKGSTFGRAQDTRRSGCSHEHNAGARTGMKLEVGLVRGTRLAQNQGLPKVVFGDAGRMELPAVLPLARLCSETWWLGLATMFPLAPRRSSGPRRHWRPFSPASWATCRLGTAKMPLGPFCKRIGVPTSNACEGDPLAVLPTLRDSAQVHLGLAHCTRICHAHCRWHCGDCLPQEGLLRPTVSVKFPR